MEKAVFGLRTECSECIRSCRSYARIHVAIGDDFIRSMEDVKHERFTLESAYRLRITVRSHRHIVGAIAHIDSGVVRMDHLQPRVLRLQPPR